MTNLMSQNVSITRSTNSLTTTRRRNQDGLRVVRPDIRVSVHCTQGFST